MEVITDNDCKGNPEMSITILADHVRKILLEVYEISAPEECTAFLVRCLRVKDYDVEKAAKLVRNVARSLESLRDMLDKFQPKFYKDLYFNGVFTVLKSRDDMGRQVLVSRIGDWDPNKFDFDEVTTANMLLFGYVIAHSAETQRNGIVFVYDLSGFGMRHVRAIKPSRLTQLVRMMQDGSPGKIKGIHLVFHPRVFSFVYQLVKPFLKEKITNRVHFHGDDLSSLHKHISQEILTTSLGGLADESVGTDNILLQNLIREEAIHKEVITYGIPTM